MISLRDLPSVEGLLQSAGKLIDAYGRPLTLDAIRLTLDETRARFKTLALSGVEGDPETALPSIDVILAQAESHLSAWTSPTLLPVINATGVILHTNLGRAPLSDATL
ncbi:MAG: L-seryl-tRNA(Sec) selenium transferase, partial [Anaerolineae bacterium]|nr:L-seryl-tRNA(Sec) selenium transferase [Anaerolineae bacterium]